MAMIDEVKTALRVSIDDADITQQINSLIDSAKEDLYNTADISQTVVEQTETPALIKNAIILYVKAYWSDSETDREKLIKAYEQIKGNLAHSSAYSTYEE